MCFFPGFLSPPLIAPFPAALKGCFWSLPGDVCIFKKELAPLSASLVYGIWGWQWAVSSLLVRPLESEGQEPCNFEKGANS